jgi:hypothetical protein
VLDPSRGGRVVDELSGDELASRIVVFGGAPNKPFEPGVSGFLFMDVTYPAGARLPKRLEYRFDVSTSKPTGLANNFRAGPTRVSGEEPAQIGSPALREEVADGRGMLRHAHLTPRGHLPHRRDLLRARALRHRLGAGRKERQALRRAQGRAL